MNTWICMFYFFGQMYTKVVCCTDIRKKGVSLDIDLIFLQLAADTSFQTSFVRIVVNLLHWFLAARVRLIFTQ
uniref:Uncharacterized protein n=1 Tax=Anguilla anguilla TaxID=7936 RepID=A0A0E9WFE5_ANGAN